MMILNIFTIAIFLLPVILQAQEQQTDLVVRAEVTVTHSAAKMHDEGVGELAAFCITASIPDQIAKSVTELSSIECADLGVGLKLFLNDDGAVCQAISSGDGFAAKGEGELGEVEWKHDFRYRYAQVFARFNGTQAVSEGVYEFRNNQTRKSCYLVCRITTKKTKDGTIVGNAEWIGPMETDGLSPIPRLFKNDDEKTDDAGQ